MTLRRSSAPPKASPASVMAAFQRIMDIIFEQTKLAPPSDAKQSAYRIRVDETFNFNLFPDQDGNFNIVGNSTPLSETIAPECLRQLLQLNTFLPVQPNISVGMDSHCRNVQVWTRQPMHGIKDKDAIRLLKLMTNAVKHVNAILADQHGVAPSSNSG